jgi:hypothetical protein
LSLPNKLGYLPTANGHVSSLRNLGVCNAQGFNPITSSQKNVFRTLSTTPSFWVTKICEIFL